MRMPFTAALEKLTTGPDRSCAVPTTISVGDTPCCACAGTAANSASVATAMDFMCVCSPLIDFACILEAWVPGTSPGATACGNEPRYFLAHDLIRPAYTRRSIG